jgi:serralysin
MFVFADGHGEDSIVDFDAGDGSEVIDLSGVTALTGIADLLGPGGGATQLGADVRIDTGGGVIWLLDTSLVDLDATDFLF